MAIEEACGTASWQWKCPFCGGQHDVGIGCTKNAEAKKMKTCEWCGGVIEPKGHDCYTSQSEAQYKYRNRGRKP